MVRPPTYLPFAALNSGGVPPNGLGLGLSLRKPILYKILILSDGVLCLKYIEECAVMIPPIVVSLLGIGANAAGYECRFLESRSVGQSEIWHAGQSLGRWQSWKVSLCDV